MRAVELFAGVGGFRQGLERAGHTVVWANEWDKYACDVYDYNYQGERIDRRDITTIDPAEIPEHKLIVGGFPCQAFSVAGKRRGFDETRGTLFFDILRIARHHRTPYLLLENVKGLLSHNGGETLKTIMRSLDDSGYDAQWQVLNSKNFGVPQNRERIIIIGHLRGQPRPEVFPIGNDTETSFGLPGQQGNTLTTRYYGGQANGTYVSERKLNAQIRQVNSPKHSNERVYGADGVAPTLNTMQGGQRQPFIKIPEATAQGYAIAEEGDSINLSQPNSTTRRGRVGKGVAQTLDTGMQQHTLAQGRIRRLTPRECERLQAFPDDWTKYGLNPDGVTYEMSDTQRYKQMGNAVTTNVIEAVARRLHG